MQADYRVTGKIIARYQLPLDEVDELNEIYEKNKSSLPDHSHILAGNIKTELNVQNIISTAPIIHSMYKCMQDYVSVTRSYYNSQENPVKDYHITSAWINDMVEGDFNPPHIHNIDTITNKPKGFSTVLFLKVPEMLDVKNIKKEYLNGQLGFVAVDGEKTLSFNPAVADFYIFDANHLHFVMPFKLKNKNRVRRSLSFNFSTINEDSTNVQSR